MKSLICCSAEVPEGGVAGEEDDRERAPLEPGGPIPGKDPPAPLEEVDTVLMI